MSSWVCSDDWYDSVADFSTTLTDTKLCRYNSAGTEINCDITDNSTNWNTAYGWGDWNGNIDISTDTNLATSGPITLTGDTLGFDFSTNNTWTGSNDFGGGILELPNGASPTIDATGEIALDTTDNQVLVGDSGNNARVIRTTEKIWSVTVASSSPAFINSGLIDIPPELDGYTMTAIRCKVDAGTSKVIAIEDASANSTEDITCGTTVTSDDGTITNATVTAGEEMYIDFGATNGAVNYVSISVFGTWARE